MKNLTEAFTGRQYRGICLKLFITVLTLLVSQSALGQNLGKIDFPTSAGPEAQKHFIKGVLLLHSFEYWDARDDFHAAQKLEPDFAMAYWGEAMTYNHPVWNRTYPAEASAALNKLGKTPEERLAKAKTQREKDYLKAMDILYGEGDKPARDMAYSDYMQKLSEKYPEDNEAAAFYALSILGTAGGERDFRIYMRAGAKADEVFDKNPQHPGALHYVIHSFDDPVHAPLGLRAANLYAKIAPDAPHALHMPSHVFMALGMWEKSNASNEASAAAAHKQNRHGLHAMYWLNYGYLQEGRYKEAMGLIKEVEKFGGDSPSRHILNHLAYMKSAYLVETRQWDAPLLQADISADKYRLQGSSSIVLVQGMRAIEQKNIAEAQRLLKKLKALPLETARYADKQTHPLMIMELQALLHLADGDAEAALAELNRAAEALEQMSVEFGPPMPVKPIYELIGDILAGLNRYQEAEKAYRRSLVLEPRRALSLLGLARVQKALGQQESSLETFGHLRRVWERGDSETRNMADVWKANANE